MSGYIGVLPVPQTTQTRESFTATNGQTSFGTSGYQIDHLDVYLNGVKLAAADFTATNGSDIVLATGAALNDILEMVAFETFTIANQSFTGTTTVDTLVVTNTVDGRDVSVDGAKLDTIPIVSTSSTPSFTAKGDGSSQDGYIQLNCYQNTHGIKLKSPPHSANASYTLTFPNDDGNDGQLLKTDGSGVLSWATDSTTDSTKLPLAGGAMTGAITTNSTFDGVDVATRDAVLTSTTTTANAALPKAGGAMTGAITTNSTFDGVDIATRDAVLTSTTTTANAALPKAGGTMTGALNIQFSNNDGGVSGQLVKNTNTGTTANFASVSYQAVNGGVLGTFGAAHYPTWGGSIAFAGSQTNHPFNIVTNNAVRMSVTSGGNVGINIAAPAQKLHVNNSSGTTLVRAEVASGSAVGFNIKKTGSTTQEWSIVDGATVNGRLQILDVTDNRVDMTFDGTGNVLVGKAATDSDANGIELHPNGFVYITANNTLPFYINRRGTSGANEFARFSDDGATIGKIIGNGGRLNIFSDNSSSGGGIRLDSAIRPTDRAGAVTNGANDLGAALQQWRDLYLSGGVVFGPASALNVSSQTLDDYEEGNASSLGLPSGGTGFTSSGATFAGAKYVKIGALVNVRFSVTFAGTSGNWTAGDGFYITGMPFTNNSIRSSGSCWASAGWTAGNRVTGIAMAYNSSTAYVGIEYGSGVSRSTILYCSVTFNNT